MREYYGVCMFVFFLSCKHKLLQSIQYRLRCTNFKIRKKTKINKKYHSTIMLPLILASYFSCPQKMWVVSEHHTIHANVLDAACTAKGFLHTTKSAQKHSIPLFLSHHRKERLYTHEHNFISACDSLFGPFILSFLRMRCEGSGMFVVRMFLLLFLLASCKKAQFLQFLFGYCSLIIVFLCVYYYRLV